MERDERDGSVIQQTLVLHSYNEENSAYGLRSDKLQLLVGEYVVTGYTLYDYKDHGFKKEDGLSLSFTVVEDGLVYRDLSVDVVPRGKASFRLVKPEEFTAQRTRAVAGAYPFSEIIIHPRIGKQLYTGNADVDRFAELVPKINRPLVYNGDIFTVEDFNRISAKLPDVKMFMLGRGLLTNPFLADEIKGKTFDNEERKKNNSFCTNI